MTVWPIRFHQYVCALIPHPAGRFPAQPTASRRQRTPVTLTADAGQLLRFFITGWWTPPCFPEHFERQAVFLADTEAVVSVHNNNALVDDDGGITTIFQDIPALTKKTALRLMAGAVVPSPAERQGSAQSCCIRFLCFAKYHLLQFDLWAFAANCRSTQSGSWQATLLGAAPYAFPGLLVQTEVMANFPEKYLIGRSCTFSPDAIAPGVQHKPVIKIQSLSRKPVRIKPSKTIILNFTTVKYSIPPVKRFVK